MGPTVGTGHLAVDLENGDRRIDLHAFSAFGDEDFGDLAFINGFDFHMSLMAGDEAWNRGPDSG